MHPQQQNKEKLHVFMNEHQINYYHVPRKSDVTKPTGEEELVEDLELCLAAGYIVPYPVKLKEVPTYFIDFMNDKIDELASDINAAKLPIIQSCLFEDNSVMSKMEMIWRLQKIRGFDKPEKYCGVGDDIDGDIGNAGDIGDDVDYDGDNDYDDENDYDDDNDFDDGELFFKVQLVSVFIFYVFIWGMMFIIF